MTADGAGRHRLGEIARYLDHVVDAAVCHLAGGGAPLGIAAIVYDVIGPERAKAFELLVGGGRGNDRRSRRLRELEREERNAAGALHQHLVARLHRCLDERRPPCG